METKLQVIKNQINALIPKMLEIEPDQRKLMREISYATQIIANSQELQNCDRNSLLSAVFNIIQTGATLNPALNLAYLVPYKGKARLQFSYIGLMKILREANPNIRAIFPILVYDDEVFSFNPAKLELIHERRFEPKEENHRKRQLLCGYCTIIFNNGTTLNTEPLAAWEIEKRRRVSPSYQSQFSPHQNWVEEMQKKVLIRYAFKYLITEIPTEKSQKIIEIEDEDTDFNAVSSEQKPIDIEDLIPEKNNNNEKQEKNNNNEKQENNSEPNNGKHEKSNEKAQ